MSGITGLWNLDGAPADPTVLSSMGAAIAHRGPDAAGNHRVGAVALACRQLRITAEEAHEVQPLISPQGAVLVLDGRVDNREDLCRDLGMPRSASDAFLVLGAYRRWGAAFAGHILGDFAIAVFDPAASRLFLVRDPIGVRPLYWFRGERLFAFGSEIKALLAHPDIPARPDDDGLADYLMMGSRPLTRPETTCFDGIFALVPGHIVQVAPGSFSVTRYWDFDRSQRLALRSYDEYAEAFRAHFAEAVRRRLRSVRPVAVSVSGGLDSSSIFCQAEMLRRQDRSHPPALMGVSYLGPLGTTADERRYLAAIEEQYGLTLERIEMDPLLGVTDGAHRQLWHIEGPFLDHLWGVTRQFHQTVRERGARVLLSGHWGDQVLFSSAYLIDLFNGLRWFDVVRHAREYDNWFGAGEGRVFGRRFLRELLRHHAPRWAIPMLKWIRRRVLRDERPRPWFSSAFREKALRFANRAAPPMENFHSAHARSIYVEIRSKYHVYCMEWNNKVAAANGLEAAFPFLDRDLLSFLMAVPGEIQNRNGVPRALLRDAMAGVLPDPIRQRNWKGDFSDLVNTGVRRDLPVLRRYLTEDPLSVRLAYLDGDRLARDVEQLAESLEGPNCVDSWNLTDLFGFELWLRLFLDQQGPRETAANPPEGSAA